jgi:hypothetical protein
MPEHIEEMVRSIEALAEEWLRPHGTPKSLKALGLTTPPRP